MASDNSEMDRFLNAVLGANPESEETTLSNSLLFFAIYAKPLKAEPDTLQCPKQSMLHAFCRAFGVEGL